MLNSSSEHMLALAEIIHSTGVTLLEDDASDIGYFEYYGRKDHYYHGVHSPDHPSPFHHWQVSLPLIAFGKMLGLAAIATSFTEVTDSEQLEPKPVMFNSII